MISNSYLYLSLAALGLQLGVSTPAIGAEDLTQQPEALATTLQEQASTPSTELTEAIDSNPVAEAIEPAQAADSSPATETIDSNQLADSNQVAETIDPTQVADSNQVAETIDPTQLADSNQVAETIDPTQATDSNQVAETIDPAQATDSSQATETIEPGTEILAQDSLVPNLTPDPLAQSTPVSELRDIDARHWAAQALRQLSQQYQCLPSYFSEDAVLSRYEFAEVLNTCLEVINQTIADVTADKVTQEELAIVQRLQEEFQAELAELGQRIDSLEEQIATLEDQQFVKRVTLFGIAELVLMDTFGDSLETQPARPLPGTPPVFERPENPNTTFTLGNLFIDIDAKVSKNAFVRTELYTTNTISNNRADTNTDMTRFDVLPVQPAIILNYLFYQTKFAKRGVLRVGPVGLVANHILPDMSPTQANSRFGRRSPIYRPAVGPGFLANYQVNDWLAVGGGYTMGGADASNPDRGFFNGGQTRWIAQATLTPSPQLGFALAYSHFFQKNAISMSGRTGSRNAQAPFGETTDTSAHLFSLASNYRINRRFNIGGWVGYGLARANEDETIDDVPPSPNSPLLPAVVNKGDTAEIWNWAIGMAVADAFRKGNELGFVFGMPFKAVRNDFQPFEDNDGTSYHVEAYYRYRVTPRFFITPGVYAIFNPEHNDGNHTMVVGLIRSFMRF